MADKVLKEHYFVFNDRDFDGEQLSLHTKMIHNGDVDGVFFNQELSLQSYCNSAAFHLSGINITPELLRKLANELEVVYLEAKHMTRIK